MQRVFVIDKNKKPLTPCLPARARELMRTGKAAMFRRFPCVIILKHEITEPVQPAELKFDPGSKKTGMVITIVTKTRGCFVVYATELRHRGLAVKAALQSRTGIRRSRRNRNTRYRQPRFLNRTRPAGWLPPSLMSRVHNVETWAKKIIRFVPVKSIAVERVKFDTQLMANPEISGIEYQQGTLAGYEIREYLLEKWHRKCAYCGAQKVPLQIEHIQAKSKHGTNRVSNLCLACDPCNSAKDKLDVRVFLKDKPDVLARILAQAKRSLVDAAAMNVTRYAIGNMLKKFGLPTSFWSGGRTKFNRTKQNYPKAHWIDAACVGTTGGEVLLDPNMQVAQVRACGHGSRQMCRVDRFGFPRTGAKGSRIIKGFRTGDIVSAIVPEGKKAGIHVGRVAVRSTGSFNIQTAKAVVQGVSWKHCKIVHQADGYTYSREGQRSAPWLKPGVCALK